VTMPPQRRCRFRASLAEPYRGNPSSCEKDCTLFSSYDYGIKLHWAAGSKTCCSWRGFIFLRDSVPLQTASVIFEAWC